MSILTNYNEGDLTELNKLKYVGFGSSGGSPLITKKIPTRVDEQGHSSNEINRRTDDLVRITKLLTTTGAGIKHLGKESALFLSKKPSNTIGDYLVDFTPKPPTGGLLNSNRFIDKLDSGFKNAVSNVKANLKNVGGAVKHTALVLASTLAQVPVNGTGTHFVRGFGGTSFLGGRLQGEGNYLSTHTVPNGTAAYPLPVDPFFNPNKNVDSTLIKPPSDSRNKVPKDVIKENRLFLGTPSKRKASILDNPADRTMYETVDKVNALAPYVSSSVDTRETNDIIKFRFKVITPESETYLHFRAYLDSFDDSFTGNWSDFNYVGRGENFHTYQNFNRSIGIGFKIAAQTRYEMRPLYQKIVTLASATAPTYSAEGFMRGTLVQATVGSYIRELPGFLTSVNFSWDKDYPWEIALDGSDQQELPMILNCQLQFTPIHRFTPQTGLYHYMTTDEDRDARFFTKGKQLDPPVKLTKPGGTEPERIGEASVQTGDPNIPTTISSVDTSIQRSTTGTSSNFFMGAQ